MRSMSIVFVLVLVLLPALAVAKPRNEEVKRYHQWRRQMEGILNENDLLYRYSAGVLARRLDANHARLRIGLAGRVPNHSVKWQALRSATEDLSDTLTYATGTDGWAVAKGRNEEGPGNFVENEATIEIGPEAGAIAITIVPIANKTQPGETIVLQMTVLLLQSWVFATQDFNAPQDWLGDGLPNKPLQQRPRSAARMVP